MLASASGNGSLAARTRLPSRKQSATTETGPTSTVRGYSLYANAPIHNTQLTSTAGASLNRRRQPALRFGARGGIGDLVVFHTGSGVMLANKWLERPTRSQSGTNSERDAR